MNKIFLMYLRNFLSSFFSSSLPWMAKPMKSTARNESWKDRLKIHSGSQRARMNAAKRREFNQKPFLPRISPTRKRLIITNDLIAGMLAPERPRYASIKGMQKIAAACEGVR
jgi:hypothetical protein